jgi:hypothetical protein
VLRLGSGVAVVRHGLRPGTAAGEQDRPRLLPSAAVAVRLLALSSPRDWGGCPEFRRTSVAAGCASGCDDLLILHDGCDGSGDFGVEGGAQFR